MLPWRAILRYHGAFQEEIEQSRRDWSDQKSDLKERYIYILIHVIMSLENMRM